MNDLKNSTEEPKKETRGRKRKNLNPQPIPQPLEGADSDSSLENNNVLAVDIEGHAESESGLTWQEKLKRASENIGLLDADDSDQRIETRGRKKKTAVADEFSTLVVALLTLGVSFANIPEQVKPNQSELAIFSNHLTGILIRHLPISNKFSADSLDIIGLVAVCSGWYARVAPEIKALNAGKDNPPPPPKNIEPKTPPPPADPVLNLSPRAADYLESVQKKAIENAANN